MKRDLVTRTIGLIVVTTVSSCAEVGEIESAEPWSESTEIASIQQEITGADRTVDSNTSPVFPSVVSVATTGGRCTGTIVSPTHVLTAAHCGEGVSISLDTPSGAGAGELSKRRYNVVSTETYPDPAYDFAVMKLERPIPSIGRPGAPDYAVAARELSSRFASTATGHAVGYSETAGVNAEGHCVLGTRARRSLRYAGGFRVSATQIAQPSGHCADDGYRGPDPGDSGGPLFDDAQRVVGVFSHFGGGEAVWSRLNDAAIAWIEERAGQRFTLCTHEGARLFIDDFNGDGIDDLLCRGTSTLWMNFGASGRPFQNGSDFEVATSWCTHRDATLHVADFNGDGRADLLCRDPGRLWIDYANSSGHVTGTTDYFVDTRWCTHAGTAIHIADFNADGRADLMCRDPGRLWIDYADASGRLAGATDFFVDTRWCTHAGATFHVADFNGDRRADLMCRGPERLSLNYADASGHFENGTDAFVDTRWCTHSGAVLHVADFSGDGRADLLCHGAERVWLNYADGEGRFNDGTDFWFDTNWCRREGAELRIGHFDANARNDLMCREVPARTLRFAFTDAAGQLFPVDE